MKSFLEPPLTRQPIEDAAMTISQEPGPKSSCGINAKNPVADQCFGVPYLSPVKTVPTPDLTMAPSQPICNKWR